MHVLRKGVIEFHGVFYTIDNIIPKDFIQDCFLLYHFKCTEDKYVTSILVEDLDSEVGDNIEDDIEDKGDSNE